MKTLNIKIYGLTQLLVTCYVLFIIVAPVEALSATIKSVGNSGLVGYWTLDEGAGTKANDMSGNKNPGTTSGSITWDAGRRNKSLGVTGGSYLGIQSSNPLIIQGDFTVSVWIKTSTTGTGGTSNYRDIISKVKATSPWPGYVVAINNNGAISVWTASNAAGAWSDDSGYNLADGRWHLVNVTLSGTSVQIYVDGVAKGSFTKAIPGSDNNGVLSFGAEVGTGSSRNFAGNIDDVRIYSRALSSSEIKTLYQFGTAQTKSVQKSGLVGYWTFDEGAGSKANDMSGNKNVGALIHSPTWEAGKSGKALLLNNSNSYVSVASNSSLKYTGGGMTLEAWIYPDIGETSAYLISKPWNGSGVYNYYLVYGPVITFYVRGATACSINSGANTAPQGSWHHIAATIAVDGTMNLYIDGSAVGSGACGIVDWTPALGDLNLPLSIGTLYPYGAGAWDQPTHAFGGKMDSVRFYNRVLSDVEVKASYQFGTAQIKSVHNGGLVGYWPFDDGAGAKANDMSGKKNNGTLNSASWVGGKFNKALSFNGSSSYVDAGSRIDTSNITAMTISAWVYNNAAAANKAVAGWWNGANGIFIQSETTATDGLVFVAGGGSSFGTVNYTTVNRWTHVVLVYDGSLTGDSNRLKGYVDGVQKTLSFAGGVVPASISTSGNLMIGNINTLTRYWNGKIDETKIYSRALSETEVKQLYNLAR